MQGVDVKRARALTVIGLLLSVMAETASARFVVIQKEPVPEHVLQQQKAEQEAQAAKEAAEKAAAARAERLRQLNVLADRSEQVIRVTGGVPPASLPPLGGGALSTPLWIALGAIVPEGWKVYSSKQVNAQKPVSWVGSDGNWVVVLERLGVQHELTFDMNWERQEVVVNPRTSATDYLRDELRRQRGEGVK